MTLPHIRVGIGYDIHRLVEGRPMILGGVRIPSSMGPEGHSDADCLSHAIADAILGSVGLPDIGHFFPNKDPSIAGISSQTILREVTVKIRDQGWEIGNIDAMLIAEAPKIEPHREEMRSLLAASLGLPKERIGLKATTNERNDAIGAGRAIAAQAVALCFHSGQGNPVDA